MAALREAVRTGRLAPGTRLPSSRALAADLGVARNTVADAYAELIASGWLTAKQGSGTRMAKRSQPAGTTSTTRSSAARGPLRTVSSRVGLTCPSFPAHSGLPRHAAR
jgi:GntR family transcriptional regulator/MocR family aminotransferase